MSGTMLAGSFWERGVAPGATVHLYESLDDDRPIGESLVRWQGAYVRFTDGTHRERRASPIARSEGRHARVGNHRPFGSIEGRDHLRILDPR